LFRLSTKESGMDSSGLLTVDQIAEYLNIKASTLYSKLSEIPHFKIGRLIRFRREDINSWLEGNKVAPVAPERAAKRILRRTPTSRNEDIKRIIRKTIDQAKGGKYNSDNGKPDQVRGLGKEVKDGTL